MGLPLDQVYLAFRSLTSRSGRYRAGWGQRMHWGWEYFGESKAILLLTGLSFSWASVCSTARSSHPSESKVQVGGLEQDVGV